MTKSESQDLQMRAATSGMTFKTFPQAKDVAYSSYNYWFRKMKSESEALQISPISNRSESVEPPGQLVICIGVPGVIVALHHQDPPQ